MTSLKPASRARQPIMVKDHTADSGAESDEADAQAVRVLARGFPMHTHMLLAGAQPGTAAHGMLNSSFKPRDTSKGSTKHVRRKAHLQTLANRCTTIIRFCQNFWYASLSETNASRSCCATRGLRAMSSRHTASPSGRTGPSPCTARCTHGLTMAMVRR